jgi:hypothetical protein
VSDTCSGVHDAAASVNKGRVSAEVGSNNGLSLRLSCRNKYAEPARVKRMETLVTFRRFDGRDEQALYSQDLNAKAYLGPGK